MFGHLSKLSRRAGLALLGSFLTYASTSTLNAEECTDLREFESAVSWPKNDLVYWFDGIETSQNRSASRLYLAVLVKHQQSPQSYVDKVVLTDQDKNIIGARYFESSDKQSTGYVPYLIFHNISGGHERLYLYIQLRDHEKVRKFRYTFVENEIKRSKLDSLELPNLLRSQLKKSHQGIVSTPFSFSNYLKKEDRITHNASARLSTIDSKGYFELLVSPLGEDKSPLDYTRYVIATDPVGRILGITERFFNQAPGEPIVLVALTEAQRTKWGLIQDKVAKIIDCPYIQVFVEDTKTTLARTVIWLR